MDKYEYNLKLDQMKSLFAEEKYEEAADIADSINWNKIKNPTALLRAGEIYERTGRYSDSRDVLLMAYDRSPIGRAIIFRLAEVAVKMQDYQAAQDYYDEFVEIAPHDNQKYVLRYDIKKAQGASYQELIPILEELREQEYSEEWAYELAYLYHKAGMSEKCIDACDELILWFGDGPYVERALELKMLYQPLTKVQEEKYRSFRQTKSGYTHINIEELQQAGEYVSQPVAIPEVDVNPERFNTVNLQEEIARGMQQIIDATEKSTVTDTLDNINRIAEEIPYLMLPKEEDTANETHIETDEEIDGSLKINFQELLGEDSDGQISLMMNERALLERQITGQITIEEVLEEWERTRRAAETALQEAEQRKLESAKARALQQAGDIMERLTGVIPKLDAGVTPRELLEEEYLQGRPQTVIRDPAPEYVPKESPAEAEYPLEYPPEYVPEESIAEAEYPPEYAPEDYVPEEGYVEAEYSPEYPPEEYVPEEGYAEAEYPPEYAPEEYMPEEGYAEAEYPPEEYMPEEGYAEAEYPPEEYVPEEGYAETAYPPEYPSEEYIPQESPGETTYPPEEYIPEESIAEPEYAPEEYIPEESSGQNFVQEEPQDVIPEPIVPETLAAEEPAAEVVPVTEIIPKEPERPAEKEQPKETERWPKLSAERWKGKTQRIPDVKEPKDLGKDETEKEAEVNYELTEEQKKIFSYFIPVKGMEDQLCKAISGITRRIRSGKEASSGNLIIQGGQCSGKTTLATSMIKVLQEETGHPNDRIGKIQAEALNKKDIGQLLRKVAGGCLIIENAGELTRQTVVTLSLLLEQDTSGILIILEDTSKGIKKTLSQDDGFAKKFTERITVPIFSNDELVAFARSYSKELGYEIDELAVLALYNRISNIQRLDQATTLTEVKDIVDEAIKREARGGMKKYFSILTARRYTDDDLIVLREKDFE